MPTATPTTSPLLLLTAIISRNAEKEQFVLACKHGLEGIVAQKISACLTDAAETYWLKIRNRTYTQMAGRNELFDRMAVREVRLEETDGWAGCVLTCEPANL